MKQRILLILVLAAALMLAACETSPTPTDTATPATNGQTSEAITDAITATEPAAEPGTIIVEPGQTPEAGGDVTTVPVAGRSAAAVDTTDLPATATVEVVPPTPYNSGQTPGPTGLPEHIRIDFAVDDLPPGVAAPVMFIVPTADYAALWEGAGDMGVSGTLAGLQALIRERLEPFPEAGIPALPVEQVGNGFNDLAVQGEYLEFDGLSGIRFVGRFSFATDPVSNTNMTYVFLGFTEDNQEFVSFFYPVRTDQLPDGADSMPSEEMELLNADYAAYMAERTAFLNSLSPADWSPDLTVLDAVVGSLKIPAPEAVDVAEVPEAAPETVPESARPEDVAAGPIPANTWGWTTTSDPLGITTVDDPSAYTITFNPDSTATIQADCNTVLATYSAGNDGSLMIQLGPTTLAACPEGSREAEFLQSLAAVVRFFGEGDDVRQQLSLEMMADGGVMTFAPVEVAAVAPEGGAVAATDLAGPIWQWTVLRQLNGETAVPEPARYTVTFNADGTATIQADCNVVGADYTATPDGALGITLGASTLALCAPGSLDQVFLGGLGAAQSYTVADGALTITLQLENGTMIFVPAN